MTAFTSAVIAVLFAQTAVAEHRENKTFSTVNGRTVTSAQAAPRFIAVNAPKAAAPAAGQAPAMTNAAINGAPVDGGRAFLGSGRPVASHGSTGRAVHRGGKAFRSRSGRAIDAGPNSAPVPTEAEEIPPNFTKPGALIRTTGQQPVYEKAESRTHTVDAGEIVMNKSKAFDVGRAPSVQMGPKDTLPPPNPGSGGSRSGGGAAANSGPGSGSSGGGNNNGSGNNDKDKPGDDFDDKGKKNSLEDDPTGFNGSF